MSRDADTFASVVVMGFFASGWVLLLVGTEVLAAVAFLAGAGILASVFLSGSGKGR